MSSHKDYSSDQEDESDENRIEQPVDAAEIIAFANHHLVRQSREHPYRTLGAAAGVGYVLGAGLPRFLVYAARVFFLRSASEALLTSDFVKEFGRRFLQNLEEGPKKSDRAAPAAKSKRSQSAYRRDKRGAKTNQASETTH